MKFTFIAAEKAFPVAVMCRVLEVSESGFYDWKGRSPSKRSVDDQALTTTIAEIHNHSRQTYGSPRVWAELKLGRSVSCSRKRVERLMRAAGLQGAHRRHRKGCTTRDPAAEVSSDLVNRQFKADRPNRLWVADITQHRAADGWVYTAIVLDAFSRKVVGWSIADHLRAELVCDAIDMATWTRKPTEGVVHHSDHGSQYTSWVFGKRLREAGILGSMGTIGDCYDNSMAESFNATLQCELLDTKSWKTRKQLAGAIFDFIEGFYNPSRRHSAIDYRSPAEFEANYHRTHAAELAA